MIEALQTPTEFARDLLLERARWQGASPSPKSGPRAVRTLWISDVHLGSRNSKAEELLDCLDRIRPETLYLVGDIIDEWKLRKSYYFPETHQRVLQRFYELAEEGVRVVYVAGNHDESLRRHVNTTVGSIECVDERVHETADGRRLLVLHGDRFDGYADEDKLIVRVGEFAYEAVLRVNAMYNRFGRLVGLRYRSISLVLKACVKEAVNFIGRFEESLVEEGRRRGLDGVVCGHIHKAELRNVGGFLYANDGDWVESCTALVEGHDGALELVQWRDGRLEPIGPGGYHAPAPKAHLAG